MDSLVLDYSNLRLYSREDIHRKSQGKMASGSFKGSTITKGTKYGPVQLIASTATYSLEKSSNHPVEEEKKPPVFEVDLRQKRTNITGHICDEISHIVQHIIDDPSHINNLNTELFLKTCSDGYSYFYHLMKDTRLINLIVCRLEILSILQEEERVILYEFKRFLKDLDQDGIFWLYNTLNRISDSADHPPLISKLIYETNWSYEYSDIKGMISSGGIPWLKKYLAKVSNSLDSSVNEEESPRIARNGIINPDILINILKQIVVESEQLITPCMKIIKEAIARYEQISKVSIENPQISEIDNFRIALFIENNIKKIEQNVDLYFTKKQDLPRTVLFDKKRVIYVLSLGKNSIIKGDGTYKIVKSALRVNLDNTASKVERVVYARMIDESLEDAILARDEYVKLKEFDNVPGFVQCYKFFCFAKIGAKLVSTRPHKSLIHQVVKSAFIFEEFEGHLSGFKDLDQFISIAWQVIGSVSTMHEKGMVNWDLKCQNFLFKESIFGKKVVMSDLGIAFKIAKLKKQKNIYGVPWFGPPELLYEKKSILDNDYKKAEIWALGVMLYKLFFSSDFPLIDDDFVDEYSKRIHLNVNKRFTSSYIQYKDFHEFMIEEPLKVLQQKQQKQTDDRIKILIFKMLRFDQNKRITAAKALKDIESINLSSDEDLWV